MTKEEIIRELYVTSFILGIYYSRKLKQIDNRPIVDDLRSYKVGCADTYREVKGYIDDLLKKI